MEAVGKMTKKMEAVMQTVAEVKLVRQWIPYFMRGWELQRSD